MNFLAHLYLSGDNDFIKIGNFIGDHVKGNKWQCYSEDIQKGILLHRKIDFFADHHSLVQKSKARLKPCYGLYSGIVIDVFYDHFLAANWHNYSNVSLHTFSRRTYLMLFLNYMVLPKNVKQFLPFMTINARLQSYASIDGIRRSLEIMSNRSSLPNHVDFAIASLNENYDDYKTEFEIFFKEIEAYINSLNSIL